MPWGPITRPITFSPKIFQHPQACLQKTCLRKYLADVLRLNEMHLREDISYKKQLLNLSNWPGGDAEGSKQDMEQLIPGDSTKRWSTEPGHALCRILYEWSKLTIEGKAFATAVSVLPAPWGSSHHVLEYKSLIRVWRDQELAEAGLQHFLHSRSWKQTQPLN